MHYKLYRRRFILLGIWLFLMSLIIFIWFNNYFIINILLYCIVFIICAEVLLIKITKFSKLINDYKWLFFLANSFIIIIYVWNFYDFIILSIIFVICDFYVVEMRNNLIYNEFGPISLENPLGSIGLPMALTTHSLFP